MPCTNNKKNHGRQLLGLTLAAAMLTSLFAITSYSITRSHSNGVAKRSGTTTALIQPQTPALKANGKIAFVSDRDGNNEIYVMDADGSHQTRLTNNPARDSEPAWSPDGARIVFVSERDGHSQIYVMNADGSNQTQLTNDSLGDFQPDWSPDGTKMVFVRDALDVTDLFVMNADGSEQRKITEGFLSSPVWSPDGTKFALICEDDLFNDICVMNANGSELRRLTQAQTFEFNYSPAWSPDGAKILFVQSGSCIFDEHCTDTLFVMNADGSTRQQLLSLATIGNPDWSPDGTRITFDSAQSSSNLDIFVADSSGTGVTNLSYHPARDSDPSWGPPLSTPGPNSVQFNSSSYTINEGSPRVDITLSRAGDTTGAASVSFTTNDAAGLNNCDMVNGIASPRCDYINTAGTVQFAAGETTKSFSVAIVDDSYAEGNETFTVSLAGVSDATLGTQSTATVAIVDNDSTNGANPIDDTNFFVRQQYLDFLGREPDPPGFAGWISTINNCSTDHPGHPGLCDRIHVSQQFFQSPEFQDRGYFVYRFYDVAFGRKPDYSEFVPDLARVSGFLDANQLEASKVQFITDFMARPDFANTYNGLDDQQYVVTLLNTAGVTLSSPGSLIDGLALHRLTRADVLRQIVESAEVSTKYNHQAYAVMEYFGYLRRQPDAFYLNWITVLDQTNDPRGMVDGFVNSPEYRLRFGP